MSSSTKKKQQQQQQGVKLIVKEEKEESAAYSCKWGNYQAQLPEVVRQLLEESSMVDVTLCVAGEKIQAHRLVLCACSTLFQRILNPAKEGNDTIILDNMNPEDVRLIVSFMYSGEIRVSSDNMNRLLDAAQTLQISGLEDVAHIGTNDCIYVTEDFNAEDCTENDFIEIDNESDILMTAAANEDDVESEKEENRSITEKKRLSENESNAESARKKMKRKSVSKKEYTDEMLASAIEAIRTGATLLDAATTHKVPRSTLYMHTKMLGIPLNAPKSEYTDKDMRAAMDLVMEGSSLQQAAVCYGIPKTVLWRRLQKEGYSIRHDSRKTYGTEKREAAIKALQRGEALSKVASEYKIPKTTLFRDKVRLVDEGKLPESFWKKRKSYMEGPKRDLLEEAVAACKEGKMSQAAASTTFKIPKTTIWRRLHNQVKQPRENDESQKTEENREEINEEIIHEDLKADFDPDDDFEAYCAEGTEMITYINEDLAGEQVIILSNENGDSLDLTNSKSLVVVQGDGDDHYIGLDLVENSDLISKS